MPAAVACGMDCENRITTNKVVARNFCRNMIVPPSSLSLTTLTGPHHHLNHISPHYYLSVLQTSCIKTKLTTSIQFLCAGCNISNLLFKRRDTANLFP
jgi:hypothetical protein